MAFLIFSMGVAGKNVGLESPQRRFEHAYLTIRSRHYTAGNDKPNRATNLVVVPNQSPPRRDAKGRKVAEKVQADRG